ncbi:kinase domain protein (macronuclear) [Tetrahymena thermophila SB210]|uniref:Kinase domain protein n=1 Tax=Tetrahymena thermophila (strain SB210) TaxID=312017 RepID=Q235Q7_TETTS|nr:kinase domain protein [Tetrahymena thermophila SB210]EAR92223.1 kinase domain protein [Tetrahymena thermophila SB210]|eukprot:XP_001012468.1 kinase domain protein [Tetrahymena thermophila SB210]
MLISSQDRPDCDQLLNLPIIKKKIEDLNIKQETFSKEGFNAQAINQKLSVLDQIKFPANKKNLQERLPKPSYNTNSQQEIKKFTPNNQIGTYLSNTNFRRIEKYEESKIQFWNTIEILKLSLSLRNIKDLIY